MKSKSELRKYIRQLKTLLMPAEKQRQANSVFHDIECLKQFKDAKVVLLYHSLPDELPTHSIIDQWSNTKTILLPRVDGEYLRLYRYSPTLMVHGSYNISEPSMSCQEYSIGDVDLAIIPAMAFDRKGHRLGRGKGFYDRFLTGLNVTKIGICYDFQIVDEIESSSQDIPVDMLVVAVTDLTKRQM